MEDLGTLGANAVAYGYGVSADGNVVVGLAPNAAFAYFAFRWTTTDGMQNLGTLPGGTSSWAHGVSGDGDVVVGHVPLPNGRRAFRWTMAGDTQPSINRQPASFTTCTSGIATFSLTAAGTFPFTYQWRKGGVSIDSSAGAGGNPSAATATLTLTSVSPTDAASYDCIVANACGSVTSDEATLTVCAADFNCDGFLDFFDYDAFVDCFETEVCGAGSADFNGDGFVDFFDYDEFVLAFEAGC